MNTTRQQVAASLDRLQFEGVENVKVWFVYRLPLRRTT